MSKHEIQLPMVNLSTIKDIDALAEVYTDKPIPKDIFLLPGVTLLKGAKVISITWEANSKRAVLETGLCPDKYNLTLRYIFED